MHRRCRRWGRRDKSLGSIYEARLRGLPQATQVAFVLLAEGFIPAVPVADRVR